MGPNATFRATTVLPTITQCTEGRAGSLWVGYGVPRRSDRQTRPCLLTLRSTQVYVRPTWVIWSSLGSMEALHHVTMDWIPLLRTCTSALGILQRLCDKCILLLTSNCLSKRTLGHHNHTVQSRNAEFKRPTGIFLSSNLELLHSGARTTSITSWSGATADNNP